MAQNERDRNLVQLQQAQQLQAELQRINPELPCDAVRPGALVNTSLGHFFISISAGKLPLDGTDYFAVSAAAPVAAALGGKRAGEQVVFNGKPVRVLAVLELLALVRDPYSKDGAHSIECVPAKWQLTANRPLATA